MNVSIVSGTYNRIGYLRRMVESARQSCGDLSYEVILVDGGSTDGTLEWAKAQDDVVLIEQGELLGAIKAFNAGCEAAQGDYVAILNDDIEVSGDTIQRAWDYMESNPQVGQVAFRNNVKGTADAHRFSYGRAFGYLYGQCCMTRRWLGDLAGWWGDEGMRTYGGDTRFSLRLWEMGWATVPVRDCAIVDHVADDELRQTNDGDQRKLHEGKHPDTIRFIEVWKGRVPTGPRLIMNPLSNPAKLVVAKAANGRLRTMRFQGGMMPNQTPRHALVDAFGKYGPTKLVNRRKIMKERGRDGYQMAVQEEIANWRPDLVLFQAQRGNAVKPETVAKVRQQWPDMYTVNWNGDVHRQLTPFHFDIAASVHLQLTISPDLFTQFKRKGIYNIGYWPIGLEREYIVDRATELDGPDVVFLGALYGIGQFPEAETRRDAVLALAKSGLDFHLEGPGWDKVGLKVRERREQHEANAQLMARSKMVLSISQSRDYWGYTSDRLYNICATGCPALVQRFKGMEAHGFIDGETCIAWDDFDEMIDKASYYLINDDKREAIGAAGKAMTLERHTWDARLPGLFGMIEGL